MRIVEINPTPIKRRPVATADDLDHDDVADVAVEPPPDEAEALGTSIPLPLFRSRELLLAEWDAIGDPATVDRGWAGVPTSPGESSIEERFIRAAVDATLGPDAIADQARHERWPVWCGVDPAGGRKDTADFFSALVLTRDPTGQYFVVDLRHARGLTLSQQVALVRDLDDCYAAHFRIEANADATTAQHLATQVTSGEHFVTTRMSKWGPAGIPALVSLFASRGLTIPWNAKGRALFDCLVRELRVFPRGRHDDAFDSLVFAYAAALKHAARPKPSRVRVDWISI